MNHATDDVGQTAALTAEKTAYKRPQPLGWRLLGWGGDLLAGMIAISLATVVLLRVFWLDGTYLLIWINSFTFYIFLPAYLCLAWASWRRQRLMTIVSAILVASHLWLVSSDFLPVKRPLHKASASAQPQEESLATSTESFRIFYANVNFTSTQFDTIYEEVLEADPDIVAFVEFSLGWRANLKFAPLNDKYPYWGTQRRRGGQGTAIWSRLPLREIDHIKGQPRQSLAVDVIVDNQSLRLFVLHSPRPQHESWADYYRYWEDMSAVLGQQPDPMIVVGDFNSTQYSRVHQLLTRQRFRDAHEVCGRGYATTWPSEGFNLPPIRIDHIMISSQLDCLSIREGEGRGSDHRPLIVDLRLKVRQAE